MENKELEEKDNIEQTAEYDRTPAILGYLTFIGFIIALIIQVNKKENERIFLAFHLRQAFGLIILSIIFILSFSILSVITLSFHFGALSILNIISFLFSIIYLGLIIIGIRNALNQETKTLPFMGRKIESILKKTFE